MPTLADRPRLIVNRLVDIIAYLRLSSEDNKRYIYKFKTKISSGIKAFKFYHIYHQ